MGRRVTRGGEQEGKEKEEGSITGGRETAA